MYNSKMLSFGKHHLLTVVLKHLINIFNGIVPSKNNSKIKKIISFQIFMIIIFLLQNTKKDHLKNVGTVFKQHWHSLTSIV